MGLPSRARMRAVARASLGFRTARSICISLGVRMDGRGGVRMIEAYYDCPEGILDKEGAEKYSWYGLAYIKVVK